ncbi:MAG: hypothetical protein ACYDAR_15290, partial [Thermomicrobiales bacterium]
GQRSFAVASHDEAVRCSRREVSTFYRDMPGHSLVENANAELARCIIVQPHLPFMSEVNPVTSGDGTIAPPLRAVKPQKRNYGTLDDLGHTFEHLNMMDVAMLLHLSPTTVRKVAKERHGCIVRRGRNLFVERDFIARVLSHLAEKPHVHPIHALRYVD